MTRDEAIAFLNARGVSAAERTWAMGDTIQVLVGPAENHGGITTHRGVFWLVEDGVPAQWSLVRIVRQRESRTKFESLADACAAAAELAEQTEPKD